MIFVYYELITQKCKRDFESIIVGLNGDRQKIYDRINYRVDLMMEAGLLDEVKSLVHLKNEKTYLFIFSFINRCL